MVNKIITALTVAASAGAVAYKQMSQPYEHPVKEPKPAPRPNETFADKVNRNVKPAEKTTKKVIKVAGIGARGVVTVAEKAATSGSGNIAKHAPAVANKARGGVNVAEKAAKKATTNVAKKVKTATTPKAATPKAKKNSK